MDAIITNTIMITVLVPFIAALFIMTAGKKTNLRELCSILGACVTFWSVLQLLPHVLNGGFYEYTFFHIYPGISIKLRVDGLGILFAGTSSFLWILTVFYSIGYMRGLSEHAQTRFYLCFAAAVGGAMGVAFAGNFFTLYLFYEIVSVVTYPLVMHRQDRKGYEGGRKYIVYLFFTSKGLLLSAMVLIYMQCGTLDFSADGILKGIFPDGAGNALIISSYLLCLFGFAKAGIMPFHSWLPSAAIAPIPVSTLLYAFVVVKVGVFSLSRVMLSIYGVNLLRNTGLGMTTAYLVSFTIIMASVIALTKTNLKARLVYSTISQLSYIILGVAILTPESITGGIVHITNHAFSKITLFFCAGAVFVASGKKDIREMEGIGYMMPVTMTAFAIASLCMIGIPPFSGFVTMWYLALGTMDINNMILLTVILVSSLLNAAYFLPVSIQAFRKRSTVREAENSEGLETKPLIIFMVVPLVLTTVISVLLGIRPDVLTEIISIFIGAWEII